MNKHSIKSSEQFVSYSYSCFHKVFAPILEPIEEFSKFILEPNHIYSHKINYSFKLFHQNY